MCTELELRLREVIGAVHDAAVDYTLAQGLTVYAQKGTQLSEGITDLEFSTMARAGYAGANSTQILDAIEAGGNAADDTVPWLISK